MHKKVKEWLKRYLPGEIFGVIGALLGAVIVFVLTKNRVLSAYAGAMGENIGFYGFIFVRENIIDLKESKSKGKKHGFSGYFKTTRNLFVEFGPSELLDSLIIRPFCMYIFPVITGQFALGILIGKLTADVTFYVPTIIMYEIRKKHLK